MDIQAIREHCFRKAGVTEGFPFTEATLVFKVMNKVFLLAAIDDVPLHFNIKCTPEESIERRERYDAVAPGYHMDKRHWITVTIDGSIPAASLYAWIDESYDLVASAERARHAIHRNNARSFCNEGEERGQNAIGQHRTSSRNAWRRIIERRRIGSAHQKETDERHRLQRRCIGIEEEKESLSVSRA
jgi:predicted DNA-binding protein (MmcQ/YjbR family)